MKMLRPGLLAAAAIAALGLAAGQEARAAGIAFTYDSVVAPLTIAPTASVGGPGSVWNQMGTPGPVGPLDASGTGTQIVVGTTNIMDVTAPPGTPYTDTYGAGLAGHPPVGTHFTVTVDIQNVGAGQGGGSGSLTFDGWLNGTVSSDGTLTKSIFNNPFLIQTKSIVLGSELYTVTVDPSVAFQAPGPPPPTGGGSGLAGGYTFGIKAAPLVPEPSTMALAGIGSLAVLGFGLVRRRRARA